MTSDKAKKIILACILGMTIIVIAGDAVKGKAPRPARFLAVGVVTLILVGAVEVAPAVAAAFAMVAFAGIALEGLGPIATRLASVASGRVPLGKLSLAARPAAVSPTDTSNDGGIATVPRNERPTPKGEAIVSYARKFIGVPYLWGGNGPSGFDCSGLCKYVYAHEGINIPRTSQLQFRAGKPIPTPSPGDLVFFGPLSNVHHVGIVVGGGKMIDAPFTGAFVRVEDYTHRKDITGYRRFY